MMQPVLIGQTIVPAAAIIEPLKVKKKPGPKPKDKSVAAAVKRGRPKLTEEGNRLNIVKRLLDCQ